MAAIIVFSPAARGAVRIWAYAPLLSISFLLIFLWLFRLANVGEKKPFQSTGLEKPITIFIILAALSLLFSRYKHDSFFAFLMILSYIGIYYLVANEFDHPMRRRLIWVVVFVGTGLSLYGILQYFGLVDNSWWFPKEFLSATYVNHNHFAGYLELAIPVTIALVFKKRALYLLLPGLVIMSMAFILTQSRGAWFSLLLSFFVMAAIFVNKIRVNKKIIIMLFFIVIIAASFFYFGKDIISERLDSITEAEKTDTSAQTRFLIWRGTADLILHNPLVGCGIGDFVWAFPRFRPEGLNVQANFAHNDYLQAAAEIGVLAPLVMIWIFWTIVASVIKRDKIDPIKIGCAAGILSLSLHGVVDFNFHIPANMLLFTVYAAILMSASRKPEERR